MSKKEFEICRHTEIIDGIQERLNLPSKRAARDAYKAVLDEIVEQLYGGRSVNLPGYFRLDLVNVKPRKAHNPKDPSKTFMTEAKVVAKLRRLKRLNDVRLHVAPTE